MVGMGITSFPPKGFDKIDYLAFMRLEHFFFDKIRILKLG